MKKLYFILPLLAMSICTYSQSPHILWQKSLGGSSHDDAYSIQRTTDSGYIVAGSSQSGDGDVTGNHGSNAWIVKLSPSGNIQWEKCYGGSILDDAKSIQQTTDGGYIFAGQTFSNDGDVSGNHGQIDYWVVKITSSGVLQWQKCLGGSNDDLATSVQQTSDGGYIVAGYTSSSDGDLTTARGGPDYWIVKLSATGGIQWQKTLGGGAPDYAQAVQQTFDGGYIVAGYSASTDGDVTANHGNYDYWVVKLSATGSILWEKSLGGTSEDRAYSVQQTSDSGYVVAGYAGSNDADITGNHGGSDFWIVKLSSAGAIQWQKCFGGASVENAFSIRQTYDNGYVVAGFTFGVDNGDVTGTHGDYDYWVVKISSSGSLQWQKSLGGGYRDYAYAVVQSFDGTYVVAGRSYSSDGDITSTHGLYDYWVVKLSGDPAAVNTINEQPPITITPNPTTGIFSVTGADLVSIKVYNTIGQLMKQVDHADHISISEFPAGMYFIRIQDEQGLIIHQDKVIKQ